MIPQVAETKPFKVDVDGGVADEFRAALERKKIGYSEGAGAIFRWFVAQDGMLQSLILGQVDEEYAGQVARLILERMASVPTTKKNASFGRQVGRSNPPQPLAEPNPAKRSK